ncbi:MAG TPA: toast rack family protein [Candidatus Dormibacteraeota bacterium]|nr:toast rack family protein [Candidatus Dormibacteraeota bacterium]
MEQTTPSTNNPPPPNAPPPRRRRGSIGSGLILVTIGILLLLSNLRPDFHLVARYWPLILIFLGVGKLWDYSQQNWYPDNRARVSGGGIALLILLVVFGVAVSRNRGGAHWNIQHKTEVVELQDAESVRAAIHMPAGELKISGGASKLLEADFDYAESEGDPHAEYSVSGKQGELNVTQIQSSKVHVHMLGRQNTWNLRVNNEVPLELSVQMGAGEGDLRLQGLALNRLEVHVGAGKLTLDLRGGWKKDLETEIHGGVGSATILLPKSVGVRVNASGGIGAINGGGLKRDGEDYVNESYGKSPVTLRLDIRGGIGEISLQPER